MTREKITQKAHKLDDMWIFDETAPRCNFSCIFTPLRLSRGLMNDDEIGSESQETFCE